MSDQLQPRRQSNDARTPRIPRTTLLIIAFIATLIIGYIGGTYNRQIIATVAPLIGIKTSTDTLDLTAVQEAYQTLKANYDGTLDRNALIEGATKGMVAGAGDRYTEYMTKAEAEEFNNDLSGNIGGGIGVELSERSSRVIVTRVLADSPAGKAGILAGDFVVDVNDEANASWTVDDVVSRVRGQVGTTVKVTVIRSNETKEFTVTRAEITDPSVRSEVRDGIGVLTISRFDEQTGQLARQAARSFRDQNVQGVILDVRGNGGGYLTAAQEVAGIWLDKKLVVSERKDGRVVDELTSGSSPILNGVPTIVLVNGGSASASEIVAGALADNDAATLLGEKTFGKGSVQQLITLPDGAQLKVTIARWFTPKGNNISEKGITPSVTVERSSDDVNNNRDPQLDAAVQTPTPIRVIALVLSDRPVYNRDTMDQTKKILLVEDDEALAAVYKSRLEIEGFEARAVYNGEEALSVAVGFRPDLILLDAMMPKISGFDVLDILRNTPETAGIKVIMLTALSQPKDKERAEQLGVDDYLVKSQVVIGDVIERVRYHLAQA